MTSEQLKDLVVNALEDQKAKDIVVLPVSEMTSITDFMIIASGTSNRHVKSLAVSVEKDAKDQGVICLSTEGEKVADWVLVDLGDVLVHVMQPEIRSFYDLERLWQMPSNDALQNQDVEPSS